MELVAAHVRTFQEIVLVAAGVGVSIVSAAVRVATRAGSLIARPLAPPPRRRPAVVRRRDKAMSPPLEAVPGPLGCAAVG
jgi:hypothetical protein